MSRRNNKNITKPVDNSKSSVFRGGGNNRKVNKKVGHKGDYAIVKSASPYLSINRHGGGTSGNPYIYDIDFAKGISNTLTDYSTKVGSLMRKSSVEDYNLHSYASKLSTYIKNNKTTSKSVNFDVTTVFRNGRINASINKFTTSFVDYTIRPEHGSSLYKNSRFIIVFSESVSKKPHVEYYVENKNIDIELTEISNKEIKFKIIHNNIDVTNKFLSEQEGLKISFVVEFGEGVSISGNSVSGNGVSSNSSGSSNGSSGNSGSSNSGGY